MSAEGGVSQVADRTRVVLVGRTELDAVVRKDPGVDVVRAHTALEGVGEVAAGAGESQRVFVVVGADVATALEAQTSGVEQFVRAVRWAVPGASVLVHRAAGTRPTRGAFDGVIDDAAPLSFLKSGATSTSAPTTSASTAPSSPAISASASASAANLTPPPIPTVRGGPVASEPAASVRAESTPPARTQGGGVVQTIENGDSDLVWAVLHAQDVIAPALRLIRTRTGDQSVEYVSVKSGMPGGSGAGTYCAVACESETYGLLRASAAKSAVLAPHAKWLAGWLRLRDQHAQLHEAAFTDPLTGAWNRRYFDQYLSGAIERARSGRWFVSILLFDIDNFKHFNDLYGHDAGDEILVQTTALLRSVIRPSDRVCRIGGDEFVVIFHDPEGPRESGSRHPASVFDIAARFQKQIMGHRFPKLLDLTPGTLTVSGGLATYPWDGQTPAELLTHADQLALESKRAGKNAITIGPGARLVAGGGK